MDLNNINFKEIISSWRTFQLEDEPELIHIHQVRDDEYIVVYEDAYDINTGEVDFFNKESLERRFNIKL